ncbi:nitroreductase family protein [[Eubacterium] cellulosolvens]
MDVLDTIKQRKSVRRYLDKPIEEEKLLKVLEAGRLAPSARNLQEWRFIIVRDPDTRRKVADAANGQTFIGEAPVVIVACAQTDQHLMKCGQPAYTIDVTIALDHISLAAVEQGLGTCWIGAFSEKRVKEILSIPDEIRVVELMPLGYPQNPSSIRKNRYPLTEIVKYDAW